MEITRDEVLEQRILQSMRKRKAWRGSKDPKRMDFALFELITCLNKSYLKRSKEYPISDSLEILFTMGNASEKALTGNVPHLKSLFLDEVYMGVDYTGFRDTGEFLPWECKMSFMSSRKSPSVQFQIQMLSYMKGYTTNFPDKPPCTVFALPCIHIMGDWKWVYDKTGVSADEHPVLRSWRCEATQEEIDDNWDWVQSRKGVLQAAIIDEVFPSELINEYCEGWMCERCECWDECPAPGKPHKDMSVPDRKAMRQRRRDALKAGKTSW